MLGEWEKWSNFAVVKNLVRHIEYLLSRNECVIVPNFGAFLAHYQSAQFDAEGLIVTPPQRIYTYNSALTHNDGALACSIARAEGISYDQALDILYTDIQKLQQELRKEGELMLGRIGTLVYDEESDTTQFFPSTTDYLSGFAQCLPVVRKVHEEEKAEPEIAVEYEPERNWRSWSRVVRLAASVALLILIGFVVSTPITVDDAAYASLCPELRQTPIDELLPPLPDTVGTITAYTTNTYQLSIDVEAALAELAANDRNYLIVIGSYSNRSEAERFLSHSNNDEMGILEKDGRIRVYCGAYMTELEAYKALSGSPYSKQGAWVCKK